MDRNREFIELKQELEHTPIELDFLAQKAIAKVNRNIKRTLLWKAPMISFSSIVIIFVLLVNLVPAAALAMGNVPILKDLVAAVAFDPSLKAAVENDYYQLIGESKTQGDVTVNVEYMIVDAEHITLFFRVSAKNDTGLYSYDFTDSGKRSFPAVIAFDTMYESNKLEELDIDFVNGNIPEEIIFTLTINPNINPQREEVYMNLPTEEDGSVITPPPSGSEYNETEYTFRFALYPETKYTQTFDSYTLDQWVEIYGQRIYLGKLDIYPTQAILGLEIDVKNSAFIKDLNIYFRDNLDNNYSTPVNGLIASYDSETLSINSLYFESSYFSEVDKLTMYIDSIDFIDKDKLFGEIDTATKTITNIPVGVVVESMELTDSTLHVMLKVPTDEPGSTSQVIYPKYYDYDKNSYNFDFMSSKFYGNDDQNFYPEYTIKDFEENKYLIRWSYSNVQKLEKPIEISIK